MLSYYQKMYFSEKPKRQVVKKERKKQESVRRVKQKPEPKPVKVKTPEPQSEPEVNCLV